MENSIYHNVFSMTKIKDVIEECNKEREEKKQRQSKVLKQSVSEKQTILSHIRSCATNVQNLRSCAKKEATLIQDYAKETKPGFIEADYILDLTKDIYRFGEKNISEYIAKNKMILLCEHALNVKKQDICRLKELADLFDAQISSEEEKLEKDALNFNEFIKNTDFLSQAAVKRAVEETELKLKKAEEVKSLHADIFIFKSEVARLERLLLEYLLCTYFLKIASLQESRQRADSSNSELKSNKTRILKDENSIEDIESIISKFTNENIIEQDASANTLALPFQNPEDLLKVISHIRDRNLTLITNSHYLQKVVQEAQDVFHLEKEKIDKEIASHKKQIAESEKEIHLYEQKVKKLAEVASTHSESDMEEESKLSIRALTAKVALTYKLCTGVLGGQINLTMMISTIEYFLGDLLHDIQQLPEKELQKIYKIKQAERKFKQKKEEEEQRAKHIEERLKKADLLRFEPAKVKLKRRLMYRPPVIKKTERKKEESEGYSVSEKHIEHDFFFS